MAREARSSPVSWSHSSAGWLLPAARFGPSLKTGYVVPFDPEIFKLVALQFLDEAGVQFLLHAFASDVILEQATVTVVFETMSGPVVVRARAVVDCTGDGDIAALAGAEYEVGRAEDGLVQPMTLIFRVMGFNRGPFEGYVAEHPDQWRGVHGLWELIERATAANELKLAREDMLIFATPHEHEVAVNSTRVTRVLGIDVWDLTYAEWASRRQMVQIVAFLKRYVPGFADSYAGQSGVTVGVRETRRVKGEYRRSARSII